MVWCVQAVKGNNECIDCGELNPKWASVNNACYLCIKCAGVHRNMGVHISFVRSLTLDKWSSIQMNRMKNGGNIKLEQFWKLQNFPSTLSKKERLDNEAMDKYRTNILKLAKNERIEEIAVIGYEKRRIESKQNVNASMSGFGNTGYTGTNSNRNRIDLISTTVFVAVAAVIIFYIYYALTK